MTPKRLNVDLDELVDAMSNSDQFESGYWLDLETGEIHVLSAESDDWGDDDDDEHDEEEENGDDWLAQERRLRQLIEETTGRFVQVEGFETRDSWQIMRDFIDEVPDPRLQQKLIQAIGGKGAFRRFKDILHHYPEAQEKWYAFEQEREREMARQWLEDQGVETTWEPPLTKQSAVDWRPTVVGVHHVQVVVPKGKEQAAREFYCRVLNLPEIPGEHAPQDRGGFWVAVGDLPMHVATSAEMAAGLTGGYVAVQVTDIAKWEDRLIKAAVRFIDASRIEGWMRVMFADPFGNTFELVQPHVARR